MPDAAHDAILRLGRDPDDRTAWTTLVERYAGRCWTVALRLLRDRDAAADAVQDSLLALRAAARRFRPGADAAASADAWVARIAVNTCLKQRRRRQVQPLPADLPAAPAPDVDLLPELHAALAALPSAQREAIGLRYLAGLDYVAVAAALGIDAGAARVRVHRGLTALRDHYARRGVALSGPVLAGGLDALAGQPVPPPPSDVLATWAAQPLPVLAAISTGTGIIMSAIVLTLSLAVGIAVVATPPAEPPPPLPAMSAIALTGDGALDWLTQLQLPDGSWAADAGDPASGHVGTTARALLCYLGAGQDADASTRHRAAVGRALAWLVAHEGADAAVADAALRAWALSEHVGMTAKPLPAARAAVRRLLALRTGDGWPMRSDAPIGIDVRTSALAVMACRSAQAAGDTDPELPRALATARAWASTVAVETDPVACAMIAICTGVPADDPVWAARFRAARAAPVADGETRWLAQFVGFHVAPAAWLAEQRLTEAVDAIRADAAARRAGAVAHGAMALEPVYRALRLRAPTAPPSNVQPLLMPVPPRGAL